jgi:hypothetical protein
MLIKFLFGPHSKPDSGLYLSEIAALSFSHSITIGVEPGDTDCIAPSEDTTGLNGARHRAMFPEYWTLVGSTNLRYDGVDGVLEKYISGRNVQRRDSPSFHCIDGALC